VHDEADYVKGDRFRHPEVERLMPAGRLLMGRVLSKLTGLAAGLDQVSDSQCGYTAIASRTLDVLDLDDLWPRYGYPNDLLGQLARARCRIAEVSVRPVYGDESSGIRPWHVAVIGWLLVRVALRRWQAVAVTTEISHSA
jgi:hypothetical protein